MEEFDKDHNGTLDFNEFRQLYRQKLLAIIEDYNQQGEEASEQSEMLWQCDVCETPWDTLEEAEACEARCHGKAA